MRAISVAAHMGSLRKAGMLSILSLPLCASAIAQQAVPYGTTLEKHFGATNAAPDWNQMTGAEIKALDFEEALKAQVRKMAQTPPQIPSPELTRPASEPGSSLVLPVVLPSVAMLAVALTGLRVKRKFDALALASEHEANRRLDGMVSDPALEAFFVELRDGLGVATHAGLDGVVASEESPSVSLKEFFASIGARFAKVHGLVTQLGRSTEGEERKGVLSELCEHIHSIKESARIPALQPVWILACALEGLLTQLSREESSLNPSAQRTATAAIDLLQALCVQDLKPNLATDPPVRILAVDDDAVSRRAISFALKKAFDESTLAPDGQAALELVSRQAYDVIFLDVEMPGMDGFELCTKIRETAKNKNAPVVFVTRHSDFDSRAKSSLSGGQDLIGKPFLSFEITVKALTLVLGNRLRGGVPLGTAFVTKASAAGVAKVAEAEKASEPGVEKSPTAVTTPARANRQEARWRAAFATTETTTEGQAQPEDSKEPGQGRPAAALPDTFSAWAPVYLETLRDQLQAAILCNVPEYLQELVTGAYLSVHSFSLESERACFSITHQLSSALEAMLKKLTEKPDFCTPSVWNTALATVNLLSELSAGTDNCPGFNDPPARILVVDDDPVARRAVSGAIQLVFGRPEQAENGEAAVTAASEKSFDLILLDILMPGIDGFAACRKIRESGLNRRTPIVFISNHDDAGSREKAAVSGGSGFIPKPVFASQIKLTALTSILRSRLEQRGSERIVSAQPELVSSLV